MTNELNIKITGNPFIDSGIYALKFKSKKEIDELSVDDLKDMNDFISDLYIESGWKKNIYSIFPNSILVNPASTNKPNLSELFLNNLNKIVDSIKPSKDSGSCMSCGIRDADDAFGKDAIPLTGSKSLINYFPFGNSGADYCSLCALLVQYSPLAMYQCGGMFIVLHSNSEKVMRLWTQKSISNINLKVSGGDSSGCYNQGFTRPTNAIFNMIAQVLSNDRNWRGENPSFNFYHFTNYNQNPELDIYTLPTNVFKFLAEIPGEDKRDWNFIIKKSYKYVKWNKIENEDEYKNSKNIVFENLIKSKSILKSFYTRKFKKTFCRWKLVKLYLKEIRSMDEKRIEVIRDVGDKLSNYIKNNDNNKTLSKLEQASNYTNFRNILRKIYKNNNEEKLFTFDEYVTYLFPEGSLTWRETQDLLLFRIYENLHNWLIEMNYVEEKSEEEILEEN